MACSYIEERDSENDLERESVTEGERESFRIEIGGRGEVEEAENRLAGAHLRHGYELQQEDGQEAEG